MNHAQLRSFYAVAREGGFTSAARAFNLTQPTISGQVKALEETYGVRLFERRGRRVETTPLGEELLDLARRIFDLEDQARDMLAVARDLGHGSLRVGADEPVGETAVETVSMALTRGVNLIGWLGAPATSADLLAGNADLDVIWSVRNGVWVADSERLPSDLRTTIAIGLGSGLVIVTTQPTVLESPAA